MDDATAPSSYSVIFGERAGKPSLHLLYRGHRDIGRSRRPDVVIHTLLAHLNDLTLDPMVPRLRGLGFVRDGGVVLAPGIRAEAATLAGSRLSRARIKMIDAPRVDLPDGSNIEVPALTFDVANSQVLAAIEDGSGPIAGPGRYQLRGVILPRYEGVLPPSQASAIVRLVGAMTFPASMAESVVDTIASYTQGVPVAASQSDSRRVDRAFLGQIDAMLATSPEDRG